MTHASLRPALRLAAAAVFLAALTATASAATIVSDGGFEAAGGGNVYYAGQSIDGGSWRVTAGSVYIDSADPDVYDGMNSLNITAANLYVPNTLAQTIATVAGQRYTVSFYADSDSPNTFALTENGIAATGAPTTIAQNGFPGTVGNSSLFTNYFASFTAGSTTTLLNLSGTANPGIGSAQSGSVIIDDFSILPAATPTPEPSTILLTLTGLLGLGKTIRRKLA